MEGEDDVVGVCFDEGVEVGSVLLEWCCVGLLCRAFIKVSKSKCISLHLYEYFCVHVTVPRYLVMVPCWAPLLGLPPSTSLIIRAL